MVYNSTYNRILLTNKSLWKGIYNNSNFSKSYFGTYSIISYMRANFNRICIDLHDISISLLLVKLKNCMCLEDTLNKSIVWILEIMAEFIRRLCYVSKLTMEIWLYYIIWAAKYSATMTLSKDFHHWNRKLGSFLTKINPKKFRSICWCATFSWILTTPSLKFTILKLYGLLWMNLSREYWIRSRLSFIFQLSYHRMAKRTGAAVDLVVVVVMVIQRAYFFQYSE